jgi:hypothetical protein
MTDGSEWFAPKRLGFGSGRPVAWQGWLLLAGYVALMAWATTQFADRPIALFSLGLPATILFLVVAKRTTKGGWQWRNGDDR